MRMGDRVSHACSVPPVPYAVYANMHPITLKTVLGMLTWLLNWRMEKISSRGSSQLACKESDFCQSRICGGVQNCI
jgi:hypothetical protein